MVKVVLVLFAGIATTAFSGVTMNDRLMPCPDCGKTVSRRALMCPTCGCRGSVIEDAAQRLPRTIVGDVFEVDCDGVRSFALPVEFDGGRFAVMPFDAVLGASRVRVFKQDAAKSEVQWMVPELSESAPIVRMSLTGTNFVCWTVGGDYAFDGTCPDRMPNLVNGVVSRLCHNATNELSGLSWCVLQPKQMRSHGQIVKRMLRGEAIDLPSRTHPFFRKLESQLKGVKE